MTSRVRSARAGTSAPLLLPLLLLLAATSGCSSRPDAIDPLIIAEDVRRADAPAIRAALESTDPVRRRRATLALGRIQDARSAESLAHAAADEDRTVRVAALFALGQLGLAAGARAAPSGVAACDVALGSDDPEIVALAVEAMGKLAPDDLESRVLALADHPAAIVRVAQAHALFRRRFVPTWRGQTEDPPPLGRAAHEWLARALHDRSVEVRRAAAHACSRFGEPVALGALSAALEGDDELVRLWTARALARREPTAPGGTPAPILARAARDLSPRVRVEAIAGLAAHGARASIPLAAANDESFHVRAAWAAAQAVAGELDGPTRATLERLLADESATVRAQALVALATRVTTRLLPTIAAWLDREHVADRVAAIEAAAAIGEPAVELLLAIETDDVPTNVARLDALGGIVDSPDHVDALIVDALESDDLALRGTAVATIDAGRIERRAARLIAAFAASPGQDWVELREAVLDALQQPAADGASEAEIVILLRDAAASDPAESVRLRAANALRARGLDPPDASVAPSAPSRLLAAAATRPRPRVAVETERGTMTLELFAADAPVHVALFLELVDAGFYDGLNWHRVVPNFVIQGGDPRGDGWGGAGTALRDEINRRPYRRGSLGMPKAGKDTGGGQLFVTHIPTPHLDGNYTVFGQVSDGESVIDRIDRGDRIIRVRRLD